MNVIDQLEAIVRLETAAQSGDPLRLRIRQKVAGLPGMAVSEHSKLRWFEYEIDIAARASVEAEAEMLTWLRSLEIAAAPEVAAMIPIEGDNCVLVRRYWACPGEQIRPAKPRGESFREDARTRFRQDMEKLVRHGKLHPWARGHSYMLVSETSGSILLTGWFVLKSGTEQELNEFLESIDFQLGPGA